MRSKSAFRSRQFSALALGLVAAGSLPAAITLDGTLGTSGSLTGPNYAITENLGQTRGNNLFHSFGQFSLANGEIATFSGSANINNIIARVTGGSVSSIDGTISSTISGANLYLINPSGIVFGANARLDVSGSFHATTADYLTLADGGRFDARTPANSVLTSAAPAAFGFLTNAPAPITVNGALSVAEGQTLSLTGGNLTISGNGASLTAPGGVIRLTSVGSAGEAPTGATLADLAGFTTLGDIYLGQNTLVSSSGNGGGSIVIRGGQLVMESAAIEAINTGDTDATGVAVDIGVRGMLSAASESWVEAGNLGAGRSGDNRIIADSVQLDFSYVEAYGGGNITINARDVLVTNDAAIIAGRINGDTPDSGNISIVADTLTLSRFGGIRTEVSTSNVTSGSVGNIRVSAREMAMTGGAQITTSVLYPVVSGTVGSISIAAELLTLSGAGVEVPLDMTGIYSLAIARGGQSGGIEITSRDLRVLGGARIDTSALGGSKGGTIRITSDKLLVSGRNTTTDQVSSIVSLVDPANRTGNVATPQGGDVEINAGELVVRNHGRISVEAQLDADAGSLRITANDISLSQGGHLLASASGTGNAGDIELTANHALRLSHSSISTEAAQGDGGNITITANKLVYLNDSSITTSVQGGAGNGGNISIDPEYVVLNASTIAANAYGGSGGNVTIVADNFLSSPGSLITASSAFGLQGTVLVNSTIQDVGGEVDKLAETAPDAATRFKDSCATRGGPFSRFIVPGPVRSAAGNGLLYSNDLSGISSGSHLASATAASSCHL